jgi:type VI secretion system protein ImpE
MAGRLSEARQQLTEEIRAAPADLAKRTVLFQVLAFLGEWDKAERHLDAIGSQSEMAETGVQVYKNLILAEKQRSEVRTLRRRPNFLPEAPPYAESHFMACERLMEEDVERAAELFRQVDAQRLAASGTLNGKNFADILDTDAFLRCFLEAIVEERYVWIPFEAIEEITIAAPKTLLDLLWAPTRVTTWQGLTMSCYVPVLYPDSSEHSDDRVKLGRVTDWGELGEGFSKGAGQHVLQIGDEEVALLEIREVLFVKSPLDGEEVGEDEKPA